MDTLIINLMDCINGTSTNKDGYNLYNLLKLPMESGKKIQLSFKDCTPMSSSFMNSAFGELIDTLGFEKVKSSLSLINYTPSMANKIKSYMQMVA